MQSGTSRITFSGFINKRLTQNTDRISGFNWNPCSDSSYIYKTFHNKTGAGESSPGTRASKAFLAFPSGTTWPSTILNYNLEILNGVNPSNETNWTAGSIITGTSTSADTSLVYAGTQYLIIPLDGNSYSSNSTYPTGQWKMKACSTL
jgi:hypothetical protein